MGTLKTGWVYKFHDFLSYRLRPARRATKGVAIFFLPVKNYPTLKFMLPPVSHMLPFPFKTAPLNLLSLLCVCAAEAQSVCDS